jgi:hypothetical protein
MNAHVSIEGSSGIQGWSTEGYFDEYIIFCVGNDIARESAFRSWATANGVGFKNLIGKYEGLTERSFIVNCKNDLICREWYKDERTILHLSSMYRKNMEGMMQRFGCREATLQDARTRVVLENLGWFRTVTPEYAMKQDAWTLDLTTKAYWITQKVHH